MSEQSYKIALLFNANKVYDRGVIEGIGQYIQASQSTWDIFMEDDFTYHKEEIKNLSIDGIIADFDDIETAKLLDNIDVPIIAVGGSYQNPQHYPDLPYVATNNYALVEMAFLHLKQKGINQFAFYGYPTQSPKHWAIERQKAFVDLMQKYDHQPYYYLGDKVNSQNWAESQAKLCEWLTTLPTHTGIIAVTDARARHLLQACEHLKIVVPDQLCIIGIDNEELIQYLSRISLSSVVQATRQIGYQAAKLLDQKLAGKIISHKPLLIPPVKVEERRSTDYRSLQDPLVIQAMHFIRHRACQGIKVEQVLDHLRISRSNLEQRFKQEIDKTIHQVIHEEKLNRAKYMLRFTEISTQEIAEICGYPSLQYFYAVFKKEYGKTPREFRAWHNQIL
ncbi:AraC family transcriptional regulator [Canicola haemoglobinophilus]|uniref:AraC family transcriptional regulator n=1 Tax=Canicola haemoglobinophilus TaxID=733 RepID=A0AB38HCL1_9PAST|nr:XylR family transcriptional regulator [Canicola haemoglobinophilus]STO55331.1 AraC family transcriptional regulator [Canicola haemoglobinophilus]STO69099.1 AraC family transcriptional regulator [Canicola haemoglobinophilus]